MIQHMSCLPLLLHLACPVILFHVLVWSIVHKSTFSEYPGFSFVSLLFGWLFSPLFCLCAILEFFGGHQSSYLVEARHSSLKLELAGAKVHLKGSWWRFLFLFQDMCFHKKKKKKTAVK